MSHDGQVDREAIEQVVAEFQPFHSEYQLEQFVIRNGAATPWGVYKQLMREVHTRWFEYQKDELRVRRAELEIERIQDLKVTGRGAELAEIDVAEKRLEIEHVSMIQKDRVRELRQLLTGVRQVRPNLPKELTDAARDELEAQDWRERAKRRVALDRLTNQGQISAATTDFVLALPEVDRLSVLGEVNSPIAAESFLLGIPEEDLRARVQAEKEAAGDPVIP